MKILVTGSSGFIGFHLCQFLSSKGFEVIGIDNHNNYYSNKIKLKRLNILKKKRKFKFKKIDLTKKGELNSFFLKHTPKVIFHLAGQPGVLYSFKNPKSYLKNNYLATKNLVECVNKYDCNRFIFGSSSSVYGDQKRFPLKENFKLKPKNYYAKTKLMCEKLIMKKVRKKFIIFRFFTVYGPFGRPDMFIHKFLNNIAKKNQTKIFNYGKNFRDFTYVNDVVKILQKSITTKVSKKIINLCRSSPIETLKLINLMRNVLKNNNLNILYVEPQLGEMLKTYGDNSKLKKYFGKIKFTNIEDGIKTTINTFKKFKM